MLAMLGYSRPGGPGEATYIVMECTWTYHESWLMHFSTTEEFVNRLHSILGVSQLIAWSRHITSVPENGAWS